MQYTMEKYERIVSRMKNILAGGIAGLKDYQDENGPLTGYGEGKLAAYEDLLDWIKEMEDRYE